MDTVTMRKTIQANAARTRARFLEAAREAEQAGDVQEAERNRRQAAEYEPATLQAAGW